MAEIDRDDAVRVDPGRQVDDLLGVLEAARRLATVAELPPLLAHVEQSARRLLDCERALIYVHDRSLDRFARPSSPEPAGSRPPVGRGIVDDVLRHKATINVDDRHHDRADPVARSVLACPVVDVDGEVVGVLLAIDSRRGRFDDWDEVVAGEFGKLAGAAVQRQGVCVGERAHRYERDIDVARQIQQALLPRHPPVFEGFDIAGWCQPADETGGDFFDFQDRGDGRLGVAIGDVSGHGFGPAMVVAAFRAFLRATLIQTDEPSRVITQVNQLLCHDHLEDRFVTAFFGVLRRGEHQLDYVSAGQGPILYYSHARGELDELEIQGFPLGLSPDLSFGPPATVSFDPGDFLALITDGFFEWFNPHGECFGIDRMKAQVLRDRGLSAADIIRHLHANVLDFAEGSPQPDDLTAVVIKRL